MARMIAFEGRTIQVPDDATDDEVAGILGGSSAAPVPALQPRGPQMTPEEADFAVSGLRPQPAATSARAPLQGDSPAGIAKAGAQGAVQGLDMLLDAPVHAVNQAPRLLNMNAMLVNKIMGRDVIPYAGAISDDPLLPSDIIHAPDRALGARQYEPQGPVERIANRAGQELGASAVPTVGALYAGGRLGLQGARALGLSQNTGAQLAAPMVEAAAANPAGLVGREAAGATAAGLGAGAANEVARAATGSDHNPVTDLIGAILGVGALGVARPVVGAAKSMAGTAIGSTRFADDVARGEVANDLLANSTTAQRQVASGVDPGSIDAQPLADQLRRPSDVERVVPGYQADIADRSGDPGLMAYVFNKTTARPGLDTGRRGANQQAVENTMSDLAPQGSAGQFRADLQGGVDTRIAQADNQADIARRTLDEHAQRLAATMTGEARGADIRAAIQAASDRARAGVAEAYAPINRSTQEVDVAPLAESFGGINRELSVAERQRFRPAEADIPRRLVGPAEADGPVNTGLLDASGAPIMREPAPGNSQQSMREVTGLRSSLTDDARAARSANRPAEARIIDQHVTALDNYLDEAVPGELRGQYDAARAARRDFGDRFERPQNAVTQVLSERHGVYDVPDSGVAPRFAQSDEGRLTDLQQLVREAGGDARVRPALRDQFLANIRDRGLLERPDQLGAYLDRHATLLNELPGLRDELLAGGEARRAATGATELADTTRRDLTTPGRSAEASYLRYGPSREADAMRSVLGAADPEAAAKQLLATAGGDRENARAAFWNLLREKGSVVERGLNGEKQVSGRRLSDFLAEPKNAAVARVLYEDKPEQLANMTAVFDALAGAGSASRARRPGSSGTAQAMKAGYDPALSASSIASRVRSINRGQLSPAVAGIDLIATFLRRRSAQIQRGAIERLQDEVIQSPELAARLLEDYNPATYAAKRRELLTVGGVRATEAVKLFDEAHDEEQRPVAAAVRAGAR